MSNPNEEDNVNSGALGVVVGIVAIATLAIALVVTSLVRQETESLGEERSAADRNYRSLKAEQLSLLNSPPSWVDRAKGLVSLPIERAMALTLEAVRRNPYALTPVVREEGAGGAGPEEAPLNDQVVPTEAAAVPGAAAPEGAAQKEAAPKEAQPAGVESAKPEAPSSEKGTSP